MRASSASANGASMCAGVRRLWEWQRDGAGDDSATAGGGWRLGDVAGEDGVLRHARLRWRQLGDLAQDGVGVVIEDSRNAPLGCQGRGRRRCAVVSKTKAPCCVRARMASAVWGRPAMKRRDPRGGGECGPIPARKPAAHRRVSRRRSRRRRCRWTEAWERRVCGTRAAGAAGFKVAMRGESGVGGGGVRLEQQRADA